MVEDQVRADQLSPDSDEIHLFNAETLSLIGAKLVYGGEYGGAIAVYTGANRIKHDYAQPYAARAWILSTCTDAKFRDGKTAVKEARRACELSSWKNHRYIDALAAAYAEAGDFEAAIQSETSAKSIAGQDDITKNNYDSRLKLYEEKTPFRIAPFVGPLNREQPAKSDFSPL
jgi:hypothetical protein